MHNLTVLQILALYFSRGITGKNWTMSAKCGKLFFFLRSEKKSNSRNEQAITKDDNPAFLSRLFFPQYFEEREGGGRFFLPVFRGREGGGECKGDFLSFFFLLFRLLRFFLLIIFLSLSKIVLSSLSLSERKKRKLKHRENKHGFRNKKQTSKQIFRYRISNLSPPYPKK